MLAGTLLVASRHLPGEELSQLHGPKANDLKSRDAIHDAFAHCHSSHGKLWE